MRCSRLLTVAVVAVSLAGAASVAAQSLADVAKREEERRKDIKAPSKVLTNQDLSPAPNAGTPAAAEPAGGGAKTGEADATKDAAKDSKDNKDAKDAKDKAAKDQDKAKDAKDKDAKDKEPVKDQKYWSGRLKAVSYTHLTLPTN